MKIYNTFSKTIEEIIPLNPPFVTVYACGPTVYDYVHIGNLRSFIFADTLRRAMESFDFTVKQVMNITDVDDKIIKKANEEKRKPSEVTNDYISAFFEDITKLKIKKATVYPKATEHMGEIIDLIKQTAFL